MSRTLIIGATGTVGTHVVTQLSATGDPIRVMSRTPAALNPPANVELVYGDLTIPDSLDPCLHDIDTVFLVWTAPPAAIQPALDRITTQARRIVYLSAPHKTPHPFFQQPNPMAVMHAKVEQLIEASGREWTFLRPGMFATNAIGWWAPQLRAGDLVRWPYLAAPTAPIDPRDIAAVAVRALREDGHAGKEYVMTGPESLSQREQIALIGRATGRSLHIEELSPEEAQQEMLTIMPPGAIRMLLSAWAAAVGQPAYVTATVEQITGAPARSFLNWATDHAAGFRA